MKKTISTILVFGFVFLGMTGCDKNDLSDDELIKNNDECCEGCMCGDTIELLKKTETAWTLLQSTYSCTKPSYRTDCCRVFAALSVSQYCSCHKERL